MFPFLNALFNNDSFNTILYQEMGSLTGTEGPFYYIYEEKDKTVFGYNAFPDSDQSLDPDYDSYKNSTLIIYNEIEKTVTENFDDNLVRIHLEKKISTKIQKEYQDILMEIIELRKSGKNIKHIVKTTLEELNNFIKEFPSRKWSTQIPYVGNELSKIKNNLLGKYGNIIFPKNYVSNEATLIKPLKWSGLATELCRLFYFTSKDHHSEIGLNCYLDASKEEIIEFICTNFIDTAGNRIEKDYVTKIFKTSNKRMNSTHKKKADKLLKSEIPSSL